MKPLVDKKIRLERIPGKGGWTYAPVPEIPLDKKSPFGWVKVRGTIDGYPFQNYHLMSMGNGKLFLPVKAEIRKKIGKQQGDRVHVVLFPDNDPYPVPEEIVLCLKDEPSAWKFFQSLSDSEKRFYVDWISSAKKEETKVKRMTVAIDRLSRRLKRYDPSE